MRAPNAARITKSTNQDPGSSFNTSDASLDRKTTATVHDYRDELTPVLASALRKTRHPDTPPQTFEDLGAGAVGAVTAHPRLSAIWS
ncbi:hypothetical protein ACFWAY_50770 [Rhodococcus sp. NPDC059968]|uniref:hypothetical protein n=1 Tax=Rhodococcus sp. NPDC059968 TaxID=3347017 RepID=UPI003670DC16